MKTTIENNPHAAGKAAHTHLPWEAVGRDVVCGYKHIATTKIDGGSGPVETANAAFIVRACNSHEALLAFAKTFALWDSKGIIKTLAPYEGNEGGLRELARAALEAAQ